MHVRKRNGELEPVSVDKIIKAVGKNAVGLPSVDPMRVALKTIGGVYDGSTTRELDLLSIQTAAALTAEEPEYSRLAARLLAQFIHKEVTGQNIFSFSQSIETGTALERIGAETAAFVKLNARKLNHAIDDSRTDEFEYFGLKTVYDRYLLRHPVSRLVIETPQQFFMRVACGLSRTANEAIEFYHMISALDYLPATPTLFNSGTARPQMSSCYLLDSPQDDLMSIYDKYRDIAALSKFAGGIGVAYHRVRAHGSYIKGTNGKSSGIIPWLKILDSSVAAVNQAGLRRGAACVYLETWHADIEDFLELRDNTGDEARRTYNLNLANWIPDLFMERVDTDSLWSLFDPAAVPNFPDLFGDEFRAAYESAEQAGLFTRKVKARDLYARMMKTISETGNGWMTFKDACNQKSNQTGQPGNTVHNSNLCVAPETLVLTRHGNRPIATIVDQEVEVWNGYEWAPVTVHKTGTNRELVTVNFTNGASLECTPLHKFPIAGDDAAYTMKDAEDLRHWDTLAKFSAPTVEWSAGTTVEELNTYKFYSDEVTEVKSVLWQGRFSDTYCFTEPKRNLGTFNGIVTGQCVEITEVNGVDETAVCNLGSINLAHHVVAGQFDFGKLAKTVQHAVPFLDRVIDLNFYPTETARASNNRWRPIGLGLMGLQDVFFQLGLAFDSPEARELSTRIQEEIYFHALSTSCALAKKLGMHTAFNETRTAKGELQFDYWPGIPDDRHQWAELRARIQRYGLRNSLLVAIAPTATIASIAGCYECIEPQISNLFKRETLSGDFLQVNRYLVADLKELGLWNESVRNQIKLNEGSIQSIEEIPAAIRNVYRTVWEIPMRALIDMAAARGAYVDQSQSLNLFMENPTIGKVSSMYMFAWKSGLKTTYYLRSRPASRIAKTTVPVKVYEPAAAVTCSLENPELCEACQ